MEYYTLAFFSAIFGLVTSRDLTSENGGLFYAQYLTLKISCNTPISAYDASLFGEKMANALVTKGLYKRSKHHTERTVSHDEITGMIVSSHILKSKHRFDIVNYLSDNYGNYPATGENKYYQPSDYYAWSLLSGKWYSAIFAPFYTLSFLISINKDKQKTSSKLIYFTELFHMRKLSDYSDFLWKVYKWKMKKQYGEYWVKELFAIYFHSEQKNYPLIYLSERVCYEKF